MGRLARVPGVHCKFSACFNCGKDGCVNVLDTGNARENGARENGARENGARENGARENGVPEIGAPENGARENGARENGARPANPSIIPVGMRFEDCGQFSRRVRVSHDRKLPSRKRCLR